MANGGDDRKYQRYLILILLGGAVAWVVIAFAGAFIIHLIRK